MTMLSINMYLGSKQQNEAWHTPNSNGAAWHLQSLPSRGHSQFSSPFRVHCASRAMSSRHRRLHNLQWTTCSSTLCCPPLSFRDASPLSVCQHCNDFSFHRQGTKKVPQGVKGVTAEPTGHRHELEKSWWGWIKSDGDNSWKHASWTNEKWLPSDVERTLRWLF